MVLITDNVECELVLLGDINIDTCKPRTAVCRKYNDFLRRNSLQSLVSIPTHVNNRCIVTSCIDHILVNRPDFYVNYGITSLFLSDHLPIYCFTMCEHLQREFVYIETRSYKKFSNTEFARAVDSFDRSPCFESLDFNEVWNYFRNNFIAILDNMAPHKLMRFDTDLPYWMDDT